MAKLTTEDFTAFKRELRIRPQARAGMREATPSKQSWMAMIQALEDGYNKRRAEIKAEMDTAAGFTVPLVLAKQIEDIWMERRGAKR